MFLSMTPGASEPMRSTLARRIAQNSFVLLAGATDALYLRREGIHRIFVHVNGVSRVLDPHPAAVMLELRAQ